MILGPEEEIETVAQILTLPAGGQDKPALVFRDRRIGFEEMRSRVRTLAAGLSSEWGLERGDLACICMPNSPELVESFYAFASLGVITVWINPTYVGERFDFILRDSGAQVLIMDESHDEFSRLREETRAGGLHAGVKLAAVDPTGAIPLWESLGFDSRAQGGESPGPGPDDLSMIIYTSGATGIPKGAPLTHGQVVRLARVYSKALAATGEDVFLAALPMYHSYGFICLLVQVPALTATLVIMDHWDAGWALDLIERERITVHPGAPTHYILEMSNPGFSKCDLSSLRAGLISGYVPADELMEEIDRKYDFHFCNFWGSSETGPGLISPWGSPREKRLFTVGRPIESEEILVVEPGTMNPLPLKETGELMVRGWNVIKEYWRNDKETLRHFEEGRWFCTGDLAFVDDEGYVTIKGRTKDQINRGGLKIIPSELEKHLVKHPRLSEAAVVPTENPILGENICACVVPKSGEAIDFTEIRSFLQPVVGEKLLPDELVVLDELPMLSGGVKVNKYGPGGLRELAERHPEKQSWHKLKKADIAQKEEK